MKGRNGCLVATGLFIAGLVGMTVCVVEVVNHSDTHLGDTWTWVGGDWTERSPVHAPPAREDAVMAYLPTTGTTLLFGGLDHDGLLGDSWTWDGRDWTPHPLRVSPPAESGSSLVYDPALGVLLLLASEPGRQLWAWNGRQWASSASTLPAACVPSYAAVFDRPTQQLVVLGGQVTCTWNGSAWTSHDNGHPMGASLIYPDRLTGAATILQHRCCALSEGVAVADTTSLLSWDGAAWRTKLEAPSPRSSELLGPSWPASFGESERQSVVAFGARTCTGPPGDETWVLEGMAWHLASPHHRPSGRSTTQMAFDSGHGQLLMFGGSSSNGCGGLGA